MSISDPGGELLVPTERFGRLSKTRGKGKERRGDNKGLNLLWQLHPEYGNQDTCASSNQSLVTLKKHTGFLIKLSV